MGQWWSFIQYRMSACCVCTAPSTVHFAGGAVAVDNHIVNEDSRICPVAIIHLNCMGDSEPGLSACISHQGKTNHFSWTHIFMNQDLKLTLKKKNHKCLWSCQCSYLQKHWLTRKDRSLESMLCICSGPSMWGLSHQLLCTNDIEIIGIISTAVIAYATHNCISPTLAIKQRF